jgi:hypothetical protein
MSLQSLVKKHLDGNTINYSNTEALYLDVPFSRDSEIRFGQPIFENGGLLDDKRYFCTNEDFIDAIDAYLDGEDPESADDCLVSVGEICDHLLEEFSQDFEE